MNSNTWFVFFALALAALVVAALIFVLLRSRTAPNQASQEKANARVYREQIADLDREHDSGHISQDEWQLSRDELSRRLLEDTAMVDDPLAKQEKPAMWTAVLIAMLLPLTAMGMYLWLGEPDGLNPQEVKAPAQADQHELDGMAKALAQKLESDGGNVQRWVMLARTYRTLGKFEESMRAYQRALKLSADDDIDLERIEVMAMQNNGNFEGEPWRVIREVLKKDPEHFVGLLMAGSASFAHEKYADALRYWQQARKPLQPGHPDLPGLEEAIGSAQQKLGLPVTVPAPAPAPSAKAVPPTAPSASGPAASSAPASPPGANVSGQVDLAQALKGKASPNDTVFVYATPANGERMPLAILKSTVAQLPLSFTLDDSSAMSAEKKISTAGEVFIKVRVSKTGNAVPQSGDLVGSMGPVKVGAKGLKLEIKDQVP